MLPGSSEARARNRYKRAELLSGLGAVVLGIGLGALVGRWLMPIATVILVVGVIVHAAGMYSARRAEAAAGAPISGWEKALYTGCWLLLAALLLLVFMRAFG